MAGSCGFLNKNLTAGQFLLIALLLLPLLLLLSIAFVVLSNVAVVVGVMLVPAKLSPINLGLIDV